MPAIVKGIETPQDMPRSPEHATLANTAATNADCEQGVVNRKQEGGGRCQGENETAVAAPRAAAAAACEKSTVDDNVSDLNIK